MWKLHLGMEYLISIYFLKIFKNEALEEQINHVQITINTLRLYKSYQTCCFLQVALIRTDHGLRSFNSRRKFNQGSLINLQFKCQVGPVMDLFYLRYAEVVGLCNQWASWQACSIYGCVRAHHLLPKYRPTLSPT